MYLKNVKIDGFKSFANKTVFEFNKGITAIVGPNGSGKSNIVDAIRWVLGEQSVKSLRGGSAMSDVIFSGSSSKNALNKASVTLTFDNTDHYLKMDSDEVEVKRCVYKDGDNEYFINNQKVRLKDLTDLFIDTGASSSAFNIISQGTVTDLVNSKPWERRVIIESAAGVLKYKKRKEESLKKLDKAKDNLDSLNLLINELETTLTPLKSEAEIAQKYLDLKENLKNTEVLLITKDISNYHEDEQTYEKKKDELTKKLDGMQKSTNDEKLEKLKLEIYKLDDKLQEKNQKLLNLTKEISLLESEKRLNIERTKYEFSEDKVKSNLINLKEEELKIIKDIDLTNNEIDTIINNGKEKSEENNKLTEEYKNIIFKKNTYEKELTELNRNKNILENKIEILKENILNNETLPNSVKNILNNIRLKGIHNTIGSLLEVDNAYALSLDVTLSSAKNFLVVEDEASAKEAIEYLKENKLGRATFLPLSIIKPRYIEPNVLNEVKSIPGYIGVLSELIRYDSKYQNIMENQMGNVIVAKDIDTMQKIAKKVAYKYRIVSLDGSIIYAGGSIAGGTMQNKNSHFNLKIELEKQNNNIKQNNIKIEELEAELKEINNDDEVLNNKIKNLQEELINLNTLKLSKMKILDELEEKLKIVKNDINGLTNLKNNNLDKKLESIMEKVNTLTTLKEKLELEINDIKDKKEDYNNRLREQEKIISENNSLYKSVSNELNEVNINLTKVNLKLDNLLTTLNEEYNLTYEYVLNNYEIPDDILEKRSDVAKLKNEIKALGEVNTGSIEEFNRINNRYNFLNNQKNDLEVSMNSLLNIISDMDNIMSDKFRDTFNKVATEFSKVFKIMFQGGNGTLELTEPDDYLNTGIDLVIMPPGKNIHNTQSLSGGEKSLTAICLLFAILNVSPVPFIVLDEVEAALDEVNVDLFGEYLNKKKMESQYILITHKKRMMEYADVLYGITMQSAGISKVVGVKLEGIN